MKLFFHVVIIFICSFFCFYRLGQTPLERWDEKTNQQVVLELVSHQTFPTLTYQGLPFYEKPPLWYMLTGILTLLLGNTAISLRLVSAVCGFFLLLSLYLFLYYRYSLQTAVTGILVLLGTGHLFLVNPGGYFSTHHIRSADLDILQIGAMLWATLLFILSQETKNQRYYYSAIFFCSIAVLTKGPLGFLPLLAWCSYVLFIQRSLVRTKQIVATILLLSLLILPWYGYMIWQHGFSFISQHILYHIVYRTTQAIEGHNQPWWFYIVLLTKPTVFPLSGLLIPAIYTLWKKHTTCTMWMLLSQIISISITVQCMQTKLAWYILPLYPFFAMAIAISFYEYAFSLYKNRKKHILLSLCLIGTWGMSGYFALQNFLAISN